MPESFIIVASGHFRARDDLSATCGPERSGRIREVCANNGSIEAAPQIFEMLFGWGQLEEADGIGRGQGKAGLGPRHPFR